MSHALSEVVARKDTTNTVIRSSCVLWEKVLAIFLIPRAGGLRRQRPQRADPPLLNHLDGQRENERIPQVAEHIVGFVKLCGVQ